MHYLIKHGVHSGETIAGKWNVFIVCGVCCSEEWVAAIRYVSSQLSSGAGSSMAVPLPPDADDGDIAQLGTSFRDPRRIVSRHTLFFSLSPLSMMHSLLNGYLFAVYKFKGYVKKVLLNLDKQTAFNLNIFIYI